MIGSAFTAWSDTTRLDSGNLTRVYLNPPTHRKPARGSKHGTRNAESDGGDTQSEGHPHPVVPGKHAGDPRKPQHNAEPHECGDPTCRG